MKACCGICWGRPLVLFFWINGTLIILPLSRAGTAGSNTGGLWVVLSCGSLAAVNRFLVALVCRLSAVAKLKGAFKGELSEISDKSSGELSFGIGTWGGWWLVGVLPLKEVAENWIAVDMTQTYTNLSDYLHLFTDLFLATDQSSLVICALLLKCHKFYSPVIGSDWSDSKGDCFTYLRSFS